MADEEKASGSAPVGASDPSIFDAYSNNSEIILGESEVAITFLHDIGFVGAPQKKVVRVVMTHSVFMKFVTYCNSRAKLIQDAYGGTVRTINTTNRPMEEVRKSVNDMLSGKKVVARFEFEDENEPK